ncbi:protein PAT1 homolog 1 [Octodon degus]|uniref:Protein PAT1 homolog 1 n=1 Tax=Octodon degus TaxID=10160 RepID=A0A6P6DSK4_OCTDE|nr:protein PAT1 homolog 1 [Octodon degus]
MKGASQSLEDCPLDEDEDTFQGLGEEDEEIDQFNDDTFGSGAIDEDWQEAHERLAELEEKLPAATSEPAGNGERDEMDLLGDHEENLAERLSKMVIEGELEDPAIMRAVQTRPVLQPQPGSLNSSIWDGSEVLRRIRGPLLAQETPTVSVLEYALPQRPQQGPEDERDLSERALPRRSTSPVIGSPPVRAVPIGTPPKQVAVPSFNQQILCPKPVHVRPPMPPRYPAPYGERMSPNQLCSVPNSPLLGPPFPSAAPVLSPLQRAQLLGGAQLQPGRMSPSQFARVPGFVGSPLAAMNPKLLQGRVGQMLPPAPGFRAFFGAPPPATPPPQPHPAASGPHLQTLSKKEKQVRDKRRKTLVIIEKTYSLLLDVEDYERRYLLSLEEERPALVDERKHKICGMYDNLRGKLPGQDRPSDDHFVQIMCIRKGKRMVARILPFLSTEQAADILMTTARNLPFLIKKDAQDEVLPCLLSPFSVLLYHLPSVTVTSLLQQLMNLPQSAAAPAPCSAHLAAVLQNKFGLSLLLTLLSRGEDLQRLEPATEPAQRDQWTEVMFMATRELLRIPQASLAKPVSMPANLVSLFSRYVDQQKLNLLETKLQLVQGIR